MKDDESRENNYHLHILCYAKIPTGRMKIIVKD